MERAEPGPAHEAQEGLFLPLEDIRLVKRSLPGGKSHHNYGDAVRSDDKKIGGG
jgi:hypothetical protein